MCLAKTPVACCTRATTLFASLEITLDALAAVVPDVDDALRAYYLLMNFTLSQVAYETGGPYRGLDPAEALDGRDAHSATLARARTAARAKAWDFDRAFEFGLSVILAGLEQTRRRGTAPSFQRHQRGRRPGR